MKTAAFQRLVAVELGVVFYGAATDIFDVGEALRSPRELVQRVHMVRVCVCKREASAQMEVVRKMSVSTTMAPVVAAPLG